MRVITALVAAALLVGCAGPATVDSFCALTVRKDFADPAIRKQNRHNREADDVNENTARRLKCPQLPQPQPNGSKAGPR